MRRSFTPRTACTRCCPLQGPDRTSTDGLELQNKPPYLPRPAKDALNCSNCSAWGALGVVGSHLQNIPCKLRLKVFHRPAEGVGAPTAAPGYVYIAAASTRPKPTKSTREVQSDLLFSSLKKFEIVAIEVFPLNKAHINSLDFAVGSCFSKIFCIKSRETITECMRLFNCQSVRNVADKRMRSFKQKYSAICIFK